jgi:putative transposase
VTGAAKYKHSAERQDYRSGHYSRTLTTTSGDVELKMPKLKGVTFETAIIGRYRRQTRLVGLNTKNQPTTHRNTQP